MIRFVKYLDHENLKKFKGNVPAHSCIVESYDADSSRLYALNTDKVYSYPDRVNWTPEFADHIVEFIMSVHERKKSNTSCFSQDYTVAKFLSDMLRIQKGRFTGESDNGQLSEEKYDMLTKAYSKYILEGVMA